MILNGLGICKSPTMRWVSRFLKVLIFVSIIIDNAIKTFINGLNELRRKIIILLGPSVQQIYQVF